MAKKKNNDINRPSVRIKKVEINNLKNVRHGSVDLCSLSKKRGKDSSDMLGLYGPNGSGKTTFINAIDTLKAIISGKVLGKDFVRFINSNAESSNIIIEFELDYKDGNIGLVEYSVEISRLQKGKIDNDFGVDLESEGYIDSVPEEWLRISNEVIKTNIYSDGSFGRQHTIIDTKNNLLCGDTTFKEIFGDASDELLDNLKLMKLQASDASTSYVFSDKLIDLLSEQKDVTKYYGLLLSLKNYARYDLMIIGTRFNAMAQLQNGAPIFMPGVNMPIFFGERTVVSNNIYDFLLEIVPQINELLHVIIPGIQIEMEVHPAMLKSGRPGMAVDLISNRQNEDMVERYPFKNESAGVIRMVSILFDYIKAFRDDSSTLIVDELDSGIFEDLFGRLLFEFQESGKGQLIFTAHNLHPLEVLDKRFIRFTSLNSSDRYHRIRNVGATNNLRDLYLREIRNKDSELNCNVNLEDNSIKNVINKFKSDKL